MVIDDKLNGFLIGSEFGDACFVKKSVSHNTYIVYSQCKSQLRYLEWKFDYLNNNGCLNKNTAIKQINQEARHCYKNAQYQYKFSTFSAPELNYYKLASNIELITQINEIGLSTFILDDGNFYNKTCKISCSGIKYDAGFYNSIISTLYNKFNIKAFIYINKNPTKNYIRIPSTEFFSVEEIINNTVECKEIIKEKLYA